MKHKTIFLAAAWCALSVVMSAQKPVEKGLRSINRATAEAHIGFLASDELEGREAGFHGSQVAARYLVAQLQLMGIEPLGETYLQPFEAYAKERQQRGRWVVDPDSIRVWSAQVHRKLSLHNVLGMIRGKKQHEYVIVGAHFDHLGVDRTLVGDGIYNGADDNASGVSAVLQIARAFVASGKQPERTVIFAFWDGEEKGLLGSTYFVQSCSFLAGLKGYLNFDMIGRNSNPEKPMDVTYFYTESHPAFGRWLKQDIQTYGLQLEPNYRPWDKPVGGSDNSPFAKAGVPIIWYHTGGHPDYHLPSDRADLLNWNKVVEVSKASFLNVWNLANEASF